MSDGGQGRVLTRAKSETSFLHHTHTWLNVQTRAEPLLYSNGTVVWASAHIVEC